MIALTVYQSSMPFTRQLFFNVIGSCRDLLLVEIKQK